MATEKPDRFDNVNWDDYAKQRRFSLSINTKLALVTILPVLAAGLFDWQYIGGREVSSKQLGAVFGQEMGPVSTALQESGIMGLMQGLGIRFDYEPVDYMFLITLFLFAFYIVLGMWQNKRMTKYYWAEFKRNRPAVVSLVWLGILAVGGLIGPLFYPKPEKAFLESHQPPAFMEIENTYPSTCVGEVTDGMCQGTWKYPLGTTGEGEDILGFVIHGMTVSMQIAFIVTFIVVILGVAFGTVSAYGGGWVDEILMRFTDIVLSFPTLIMFLLLVYIYGSSLGLFILIFAAFSWGGTARYVRSKALSVSEEEFIKATRISGSSVRRVVTKHVVPNTASSIVTQLTLLTPGFLLFEAQLSFLQLGANVPSWGQLIAAGRSDLSFAPWIVLVPGTVLFLTILAFNFVGDALLDALNPEAQAEADKAEADG
jgi:peptide/nickel transport system permease protein